MIRAASFVLALALSLGAQSSSVDPAKLEKIRRLAPEERAKLLERLAELKKLPREEKVRLEENLTKLKSMSPEQVTKLKERSTQLGEVERKEYAELAQGFFKWAHRSRQLEGFPRGLFFTWLKKEKPEQVAEIRALEPGPGSARVDAFIKLYVEFRNFALARAEEHARRHRCGDPESVAVLKDARPEELWPKFQEIMRACQSARPRPGPVPPLPIEKNHRR